MSKYKGKKVLVVGFGLSGVAVARYMCKQGAKVTVSESKQKSEVSESLKKVADLKLEFEFGGHTSAAFLAAEMVVVSPGVPLSLKPIEDAKAANIPITSEVDLAVAAIKEPIIAVTGTNGKTTTTTLIGEMIRADNKQAFVCGNIGEPVLNYVTDGHKADYVIVEVSSFQLESIEKLVPAVAVVTNIDPDHLDRYGTMEAYVAAKKRLVKLAERNSYVILNYDNPSVAKFAQDTNAKIHWFTKQNPMKIGGDFAEKFTGAFWFPGTTKMDLKMGMKPESYDLTKLRIFGDHNRENLMAAAVAVRSVGISPRAVQAVIDTFKGVPHRLEFVRKKDGVYFFNDSKATNVTGVMKSLQSFKRSPVILIAGGKDKNLDFSPLVDLIHSKCKLLILLGEAKEKINRSLGDFCETYLVGTFDEAILLAYQKSRSGDIILLSPGCASYDMFRNFEERGDAFKKLVSNL